MFYFGHKTAARAVCCEWALQHKLEFAASWAMESKVLRVTMLLVNKTAIIKQVNIKANKQIIK
jgi:hypothetical protein